MEMQKVQAHLIRMPSANHLPTEQRCPAFLMPQKLSIPEPQALYPSPSDSQSAENFQKSFHITGKIALLCRNSGLQQCLKTTASTIPPASFPSHSQAMG